MSTYVVSDIHGCAQTFRRLLNDIGLERTEDVLIVNGDLIDRGPDSKGVIEAILQMQRDGFNIRPIRGNHEMMLLTATNGVFDDLLLWLHNGGDATLESYGVDHPKDITREHLAFLEGLPYYRMTRQYLFVHAGLDFSLDEPLSIAGRIVMLWTRDEKVNSRRIGGRTLVTGHSTKTLAEIRKSLTTKHILTDNGCCLGAGFTEGKGNLVAVNLDTGVLIVQPNIDEVDHDDD